MIFSLLVKNYCISGSLTKTEQNFVPLKHIWKHWIQKECKQTENKLIKQQYCFVVTF